MLGAARHPAHLFLSLVLHAHSRVFGRSTVHRHVCANLVLPTSHGRNSSGRCAPCFDGSSHHRSLLAKTLPSHCHLQPGIAVLTSHSSGRLRRRITPALVVL